MTRTYDMTNRSRSASRTTEHILAATEQLLASRPIDEVTLLAIAAGSGVTVQTVLRHMGSRDGCFRAVAERVQQRVQHQREAAAPGDVPGAIAALMAHYEAEGSLVLNLLAQESRDAFAADAASRGRTYHRAWVDRCLGPRAPDRTDPTLDALVAATDLYVWKLLRLDLGRSAERTHAVVTRLVTAVLEDQ
jgi:AcrR family transcriptional regulator